jgi:hypothetical protein
MMYPGVDDVLGAVLVTLEDVITPSVGDENAASACRTAAQLLRSTRARLRHEQAALQADNDDLRALLAGRRDELPEDVRPTIDNALTAAHGAPIASVTQLQDEARGLREALVSAVYAVPDRSTQFRVAAREYLERSLERQAPWLVDSFTGPRR